MRFSNAITRRPGVSFAQGLTTANLGEPDHDLAMAQYQAYVDALCDLGLAVTELPHLAAHPDAHFVEDTAVVFANLAVITRQGASSRRGEETAIRPCLERTHPVAQIQAPGTLDGGDVLVAGETVFVGLSDRTNRSGFEQFAAMIRPLGYGCVPISVGAGLHLKSSVNLVGPNQLLMTRHFAHHPDFATYEQLFVDEDETYAANVLPINGTILLPAGHPKTFHQLKEIAPIKTLEMSEMEKMDGGLTCLSLRF